MYLSLGCPILMQVSLYLFVCTCNPFLTDIVFITIGVYLDSTLVVPLDKFMEFGTVDVCSIRHVLPHWFCV
jgi:hypothetical protein